MTQEMVVPSAPRFSVGTVLSTSLAVYGRNFIPFTIVALALQVPVLLLQLFFNPAADPTAPNPAIANPGGFFGYLGVIMVAGALCNGLTTATLVYGSVQDLRGQRASIGDCFSRALAVAVPIILAALGYSICMSLGFLLLVIPGLIFLVVYWLYAPAIVVERLGVSQAFARSADLTRGKRWPIFGLILIYGVILYLVGFVVLYVMVQVDPLNSVTASTIINFVLNTVIGASISIGSAVTYFLLRSEKEGVDIDQIAKVFD